MPPKKRKGTAEETPPKQSSKTTSNQQSTKTPRTGKLSSQRARQSSRQTSSSGSSKTSSNPSSSSSSSSLTSSSISSASSPGEDDTFADITSENLAEDGALVDIDDALQRERDDMNAIAEGGRGDDDLDSDHIRRIRNKPMSSSNSADMVELVLFLIRRRQGTISAESFKRWSLASVLPLY